MPDIFARAHVGHMPGRGKAGDAAWRVISPADFDAAAKEITGWDGYAATPLIELSGLAAGLSLGQILYKDEGSRFGLGSFKALGGAYATLRVVRGRLNEVLGREVTLEDVRRGRYRDEVARITVASATDGNHGRAVSWGARRIGARCRIYIHAEVSESRAEAMRELGAEVIRVDGDYDATVARTRHDAEANGWLIVSDTSWEGYTEPPRDVMAGYGVMAREICAALDRPPSHVFLQGGVGGLAAAVAAGLRQHWGDASPRVVVVEPDRAPCLFASALAGRATAVPIEAETIMAGLSCGEPSELAWQVLAEEVTDFLTIPDALVAPLIRMLARPEHGDPALEAGESAVAGLAGLIAAASQAGPRDRLGLGPGARVLLIGSEGVTDPGIFDWIMAGNDELPASGG